MLTKLETVEIMIWGREGGRVTPPLACFRGGLVRKLRELQNGSGHTGGICRVDEWIERMIVTQCPIPTFRVIAPHFSGVVSQPKLGQFELALKLERLRRVDQDTERLVAVLRGLPRDAIDRLELHTTEVAEPIQQLVDAALEGLSVARI